MVSKKANGLIILYTLYTISVSSELDLNKYLSTGYKIQRLFVDPTGCHILVSAVHKDREKDPEREDNNAEFVYVHATSAKPRQVLKQNISISFKWQSVMLLNH